jgi:plastocyanin
MQIRSSLPRLGLLVALGVTAAGVAACGDDDKDSKEASKPTTLAVSVDQAGKVTSPKTIEGGVVTLRYTNNAKTPYSLQMVRVTGDKTAADVLKIVNSESAPIPTWLTDGGGIGSVKPGATGTTTQELPAGKWFLIPGTDDEEKAPKPQTPELEVTGGESGGALPKTDAKISAFEYGFNTSGLKSGNNTVEFANNGKQLHHVVALPMVPGKTLAQAKTFLTSENAKGQPPVDFENGVETTVIDGGQKQVVTLNLKSGKYALVCFITDRSGGAPHVNKGMIAEATVS